MGWSRSAASQGKVESGAENYFSYLRSRSFLGAVYRRYLLYPRLNRLLSGKCLDIGCGIGDMLAYRSNTVGVDVNPHTVSYCRSVGLDASVMEVDILPFGGKTFDSVLLDNVLEHLSEPRALLREISRVLVPGGVFLVGVPGVKGWKSDPDHKVFYDEAALLSLVQEFGFGISSCTYVPFFRSEFLSAHVRQYCLYMQFTLQDLP